MQYMYHMGLDVHKHYTHATVVDSNGQIVERQRLEHDDKQMGDYFTAWQGKAEVAMEATYNWYWLSDMLHGMGFEVSLAHPYKTKIIGEAKIKTDKIDSCILAQMLRTRFLPTSYIMPAPMRDKREWLRHRFLVVRMRTRIRCKVHTLLDTYNKRIDCSDIFGKEGRVILKSLDLPPRTCIVINDLMNIHDALDGIIERMDKQIKKHVGDEPMAELLMSIPGIGYYGALLLLYEIGDFSRFSSAKKLAAYCGLVPSVQSSGGKTRMGSITKQGNVYIRWFLNQAANSVIRSGKDRRLNKFYQKIKHKRGHGVAITALAKELLHIVFWIAHKKTLYDPYIMFRPNTISQAIPSVD